MDNVDESALLREGGRRLGVELEDRVIQGLFALRDELLRWNQKVNLTAITEPREVLEKHFLDSLAVLPEVRDAVTLLDLGAGAGFPGIPLKLARPDLEVVLVDAVGKKVAFMKHALVRLGLSKGGRALHVRAEGAPDREGLTRAERVICRAFMDVPDWLALARHYVLPQGVRWRCWARHHRPLSSRPRRRRMGSGWSRSGTTNFRGPAPSAPSQSSLSGIEVGYSTVAFSRARAASRRERRGPFAFVSAGVSSGTAPEQAGLTWA